MARGQLHAQALDVVGHIRDGFHLAHKLLDIEQLIGDAQLHVAFHLDLTGKAEVLSPLFGRNVGFFRRQQGPSPLQYAHLAQPAGSFPAAG
ncbi:hypothetical protein SDC9_145443 [bioreactor metagenome]|uniref:Uncharacterized protein n=1 Tax=bioreactor metagenome TaxID=1076179 RepID=A0A645EAU0_9ZZZZ